MRIPHIYFVSFKNTKGEYKGGYFTYFGLHRSWESTWDRIRKLEIDKDKKYIYGGFLTWRAILYIIAPFRIYTREIQKDVT